MLEELGFSSCIHGTEQRALLLRRSAIMGVVTLSRPACRLQTASSFVRLTTEARVQHKAVKRMTRNRPIKVRLLLCRFSWLQSRCLHFNKSITVYFLVFINGCAFARCSTASPHESTEHRHIRSLLRRPPCTPWCQRYTQQEAYRDATLDLTCA